jgi:Immunity protein Imm5
MIDSNTILKTAINSVKNHPIHHLEIGIRRPVWLLFGDSERGVGLKNISRKKRFLLSMMCAEYVKSIYDEYFCDELDILILYSEAVNISRGYWNEEIYFEEFDLFAKRFYDKLMEQGSIDKAKLVSLNRDVVSHTKAFCAMSSMWECLRVSLYDEPFNYEKIEIHVKDTDLDIVDYYDYDAAYCAAIAYTGAEWDLENSNLERRLNFWKWWLEEAVPQISRM